MKNFKKILALVVAMVMIIGTMSFAGADTNDLAQDTTIKITSLEKDDTVNLYQVFKWVEPTADVKGGWTLTEKFAGMAPTTNMKHIIDNDVTTVTFEKADLEAITKYAKDNNIAPDSSEAVPASGDYEKTVELGLYLALVAPIKAGIVYNPIVVSADFTEGGTNEIDSSETMGTSAVAKKKDITVDKTEHKITNDINDEYEFTVTTTIPVYSASFNDTYFNVSDEMSEYLDLVASSFTVKTPAGADVTPSSQTVTDGAHGWTIGFNDAYIKALTAPQEIVITYKAKLAVTKEEAATLTNVKEEKNKVTIDFPNNPKDDTGKSVLKDETREYTFTIDGKLFGNSEWNTLELIKVGLDKNGDPIESMVSYDHGEDHAALDGATFGLYTDQACTTLYTNTAFDGKITTANQGLFFIPGLDVGTYYLKELTAPKGYIKDTQVHTIEITADIDGDEPSETGEEITEYYTVAQDGTVTWSKTQTAGSTPYTYYVPVLKSYTIKVDNNETSYNMTLDGPSISSVRPSESSSEIVNTKGVELPSTGGIGTTIFYVVGAVLILGAGVILVTRRRVNAN